MEFKEPMPTPIESRKGADGVSVWLYFKDQMDRWLAGNVIPKIDQATIAIAAAKEVMKELKAENQRLREERLGFATECADLKVELADAETECRCALREISHLRGALRPFAHPDLARIMGGQHDSTSIVFQRDRAKLAIGDFERAAAALEDK